MGIFDIFGTGDQQAAAQAQAAGINAGYGQLSNLFGTGQGALNSNYTAGLAPFLSNIASGQAGTTAYGNATGANGASGNAQAVQSFMNNPGYSFQQQQGDNSVNATAAANGTTNSGNQQIALSNYNQGLAGTSWNNYVSSLAPYLNFNTANASGAGGLYSGLGNQLNSSDMTQGNAAYGAQTSIGNANANSDLAGLNASANILNAGMNAGGALLGFLSDARAKEDIAPVGSLADGQTIYRYRYKGDPRHQIGLLAQEVEQAVPDAVIDDFVGDLKGVDYERATDVAAALSRFGYVDRASNNDDAENYGASLLKMAA